MGFSGRGMEEVSGIAVSVSDAGVVAGTGQLLFPCCPGRCSHGQPGRYGCYGP